MTINSPIMTCLHFGLGITYYSWATNDLPRVRWQVFGGTCCQTDIPTFLENLYMERAHSSDCEEGGLLKTAACELLSLS